jgi:PBSX family phage terminase large subunit
VSGSAVISAPFIATPRQNELAARWHDDALRVVVASGAIRSGKTGAGARLLLETAIETPSTYLVCRSTFRELEDSTKLAFLRGDHATPPLIPPEAIAEVRVGDNLVRLRSGSTILFRSLDDPSKLLGLSLGGALIDQAEELDGGPDGEHLVNTILGRLNAPGPRKLMLICNPGGLTHFVFRRFVNPQTRESGSECVHFRLVDNAANLPPDFVASMLETEKTNPVFFRTYVEGTWGSFEGMAFAEFSERVHVVDRFPLPAHWIHFESMDHGAASPTAWLFWATDEDGNAIVFDEHYRAGWLVSDHAAEVLRRRPRGARHQCFADPSIDASHGLMKWGAKATVLTEYREHGVTWLVPANNDRVAGYSRLLELVHVEERRLFPSWHPRFGERGSPRLFVARHCAHLIEQLRSAPVASDGPDAGRAVEGKWEHEHGHALAALRYGAMSRPSPSVARDPWADVPPHLHPLYANDQALAAQGRREMWERVIARRKEEARRPRSRRYIDRYTNV